MGTASLTLTGRRTKIAVLTAVVLAAAVALAATAQEEEQGGWDGGPVTVYSPPEDAIAVLGAEIDEVKADLDALSKEPPILEVRAREDYLNSRLDFLNLRLAEQCSQVSDSRPEACP
ncbi:MAG: hypothetical protein WD757_09340 [Actinomycetota bacterium]